MFRSFPGSKEAVRDVSHGAEIAEEIGYPVMIKAALGGGGKGMRVAETRETFAASFQTAQKEAQMAFGDGTMYLERFVRIHVILNFRFWQIVTGTQSIWESVTVRFREIIRR